MPAPDWIQRYPGVLALLQQPDDELVDYREAPQVLAPSELSPCPCAWCQAHRDEA